MCQLDACLNTLGPSQKWCISCHSETSNSCHLNNAHTRVHSSYLRFTISIVSPVRVFQHTFVAITTEPFETIATFQPMDNIRLCFNTQHFLMCSKCREWYSWYQRGIHALKKQTFPIKQMAVKIAEHGQTLLQHRTVHNITESYFMQWMSSTSTLLDDATVKLRFKCI